ncbi:MAG: hypothetical protein Q7V58_09630 [Actinomycetota bacterium]|nr:hypothetical protein [Actinomycetota bacterium]
MDRTAEVVAFLALMALLATVIGYELERRRLSRRLDDLEFSLSDTRPAPRRPARVNVRGYQGAQR